MLQEGGGGPLWLLRARRKHFCLQGETQGREAFDPGLKVDKPVSFYHLVKGKQRQHHHITGKEHLEEPGIH